MAKPVKRDPSLPGFDDPPRSFVERYAPPPKMLAEQIKKSRLFDGSYEGSITYDGLRVAEVVDPAPTAATYHARHVQPNVSSISLSRSIQTTRWLPDIASRSGSRTTTRGNHVLEQAGSAGGVITATCTLLHAISRNGWDPWTERSDWCKLWKL